MYFYLLIPSFEHFIYQSQNHKVYYYLSLRKVLKRLDKQCKMIFIAYYTKAYFIQDF
jgi:hypothetical protein